MKPKSKKYLRKHNFMCLFLTVIMYKSFNQLLLSLNLNFVILGLDNQFFFFWFYKTGFLCVALAVLELTL